MDRGSGVYYYLYDGLGSTRQLVNTSGAVTDTWGYSAFGELASHTGTTANPFLFNAQQFDQASGTYYLRARYYDQSNGRFISQDPYSGSNQDPVSLHRYLYASGDPVNRKDPSGKSDSLVGISISTSITVALASGLIGAVISATRDAIFNPKSNITSLFGAAVNGFNTGFVIGGLASIPGLGPWIIAGATAWGGWGIGTEISQKRYGEAIFDAVGLFGGLGIAHFVVGSGGPGCFISGTPVQMANGHTKPIEKIKIHDRVFSRNPNTGKTEIKQVSQIFVHHIHTILVLDFADQRTDRVVQTLATTYIHPFFVIGRGFVQAGRLKAGDRVATKEGLALTVKNAHNVRRDKCFDVYNFKVQGDHTYFVGSADGGIWVHNVDCGFNYPPVGFDVDSFMGFGKSLYGSLDNAGYTDSVASFEGSTVTGIRFKTGGAITDLDGSNPPNDFDVAIVSQSLFDAVQKVPSLETYVRGDLKSTGPIPAADFAQGLNINIDGLRTPNSLPVKFRIYPSFDSVKTNATVPR